MLKEKIAALDVVLQQKHATMYASLAVGKEAYSSINMPLRNWYQWQNGQQKETENLFFNHYRFIPFEEAHPLSLLPQTEFSLPLIADDAGEGYWFSTKNQKVFYNAATFYDKEDLMFISFESFVDFLIELAANPLQSIGEFIEIEEALLTKFTYKQSGN